METIITIENLKRIFALTTFSSLLYLCAFSKTVYAAPEAIIKLSTATPKVGETVIFNGLDSVCSSSTGCSYTWQWYWRSLDGTKTYVGGQMGRTAIVRYQFSAYASALPYIIVALTVAEGRVRKSSTATIAFRVLP